MVPTPFGFQNESRSVWSAQDVYLKVSPYFFANKMKAPLLLLAAGQDFTPVADVEQFAERVRAAGVEAELHVYPDAPHSFFDRSFAEHADASADAWSRILDFVDRHRQR